MPIVVDERAALFEFEEKIRERDCGKNISLSNFGRVYIQVYRSVLTWRGHVRSPVKLSNYIIREYIELFDGYRWKSESISDQHAYKNLSRLSSFQNIPFVDIVTSGFRKSN